MKPGTRVICIDDDFKTEVLHQLQAIPKEGEIYTVRELVPDPLGKLVVGITLEGLVNPKGWMPCRGGLVIMEFSFRSDRFIPIDEKKAWDWQDKKFNQVLN
jgi:hypothetical protein